MPFRRIMFNVGLIYQTTPETILAIRKDIESYVAANDDLANADEATTTIRVTQFNDSSIDMLVYCFTRSTKWHDFCIARDNSSPILSALSNTDASLGKSTLWV